MKTNNLIVFKERSASDIWQAINNNMDANVLRTLFSMLNNTLQRNANGDNYLIVAYKTKSLKIMDWLIHNSLLINVPGKDDWSILHHACRDNDLELAAKLIKEGARTDWLNSENNTPLDYLEDRDDAAALQNICPFINYNYPFHIGLQNEYKVKLLLKRGANPNQKFISYRYVRRRGCTLLHITNTPVKEVKLLLEYGADVHAVNQDGDTPLHEQCRYGNHAVAKLLLEYEADISAKNNKGKTPLDLLPDYALCHVEKLLECAARGQRKKQARQFELMHLLHLQDQNNPLFAGHDVGSIIFAFLP